MKIIPTSLPIVYRDVFGKFSVDQGLNLCRVSEVWGCVIYINQTIVLLEKTNRCSMALKRFAEMDRLEVGKLCFKLCHEDVIIQGKEHSVSVLSDEAWRNVAKSFSCVQATMDILRRYGVVADNLFPGSYVSTSPEQVCEPLKKDDNYNDEDIHFRFGVMLRGRLRGQERQREQQKSKPTERSKSAVSV